MSALTLMAGRGGGRPERMAVAVEGSPDSPADVELVRRARTGDQSAFGELMDRHRRVVYRTAYAALGSAADAEDVAQETFIAVFRKLPSFRGESSFRTWLVAIAWRKALNRRRSVVRWLRSTVTERAGDGETGGWNRRAAAGVSQEESAAAGELRAVLKRLIASLPPKLRDPLLLAGSGEHTAEQMGQMLGVPTGTVKWRISEARRRLKVKLAALGYHDD